MIADLVHQLAAAVIEAWIVPKLLERGGDLYWRATGGHMIPMTSAASSWSGQHPWSTQ